MKKLSVIVLALVLALSMIATAHAAPAGVEGTWIVNTATYTEAGAQYMNENFAVPGFPWMAGVPYPAAEGACYIFGGDQFSSTVPPSSSPITWLSDSSFQAGDAVWNVSVSGDTLVLTETVLGTAYTCTLVPVSAPEGGGETENTKPSAPNTADFAALGMYATMAAASLGGLVAMKKKSRG